MRLFTNMESLRSDDGDGNVSIKKAIGLLSKTTTLHVHHAFLYISLPSLHDYHVKMLGFTFYAGRKQARTKFSGIFFLFPNLDKLLDKANSPGFQLQESSHTFDKVKRVGIMAMKFEKPPISPFSLLLSPSSKHLKPRPK